MNQALSMCPALHEAPLTDGLVLGERYDFEKETSSSLL